MAAWSWTCISDQPAIAMRRAPHNRAHYFWATSANKAGGRPQDLVVMPPTTKRCERTRPPCSSSAPFGVGLGSASWYRVGVASGRHELARRAGASRS